MASSNPIQPPPKDKQSLSGLFSQKDKSRESSAEIESLRQEVNSLSRRVREIEERYTNIRKKVNVIDMNLLSQSKKNNTEIKVIYSELNDLKSILDDFDNKMLLIVKEIRQTAKGEDVRVLQRYIDMWEPIKFVTRREVERIVSDILDEKLNSRG